MRNVRYVVAASLDGYIAGPIGEADWILMDPDVNFAELVAVASGHLPETFTVSELKAVCPGWSTQSYASFSAHCVARNEGDPLKLKRVGRGKYQVVNPSRFAAGMPEGKMLLRREASLWMLAGFGLLFPNAVSQAL